MNYLLPVNNVYDKDITMAKKEFENIITQQIIISQLANGISFEDTNNMDNYERNLIFKKIMEMEKEKNEAKLKAIEEAKAKRGK